MTIELPAAFEALLQPQRNATPEELFLAAGVQWNPQVVAMTTAPPYSGGPITGYVVDLEEHVRLVPNAFLVLYHDGEGRMTTKYLSFDDLSEVPCTILNPYIRQALSLKESRPWKNQLPADRYPPCLTFSQVPEPDVDCVDA